MLYCRLKQQLPMSYLEARTPFPPAALGYGFTYQPSPAFREFQTLPSAATLEESAACLYAALAPTGLDGLEQQTGTTSGGQKVFVDGMGQPIAFIRILYDGNSGELNARPQAINPAQDPYDPDNKATAALSNVMFWTSLLGPTLSDAGTYNVNALPYRTAAAPTPVPLRSQRNHTMAVFSAGPNNEWLESPSNGILDGDNLFSYRLRREGAKGD
jgi:hypothetical protein